MKFNKKIIISLSLAGGLLLVSNIAHAEELKETLEAYLRLDKLDLLGIEYERILFDQILKVSTKGKQTDIEIIEKIKFITEDVKTIPIQAKCIHKIITQKYNSIIYSSVGSIAYAKLNMGTKAFNNLLKEVIKVLVK